MHHSDRMHRSNRQLHQARRLARRYRAAHHIRRHPVSDHEQIPAATVTESHPRTGVSFTGMALGRRHGMHQYTDGGTPVTLAPGRGAPRLRALGCHHGVGQQDGSAADLVDDPQRGQGGRQRRGLDQTRCEQL
jgi:hypothetical protein